MGKETTQPSSYGHQGPSKSGPSQTMSPTHPKVMLLKVERSDGSRDHVTYTALKGPFADRTAYLNGEDQSKLTQHHAPSKGHTRGQKSKQKARILAGAKSELMTFSDKETGIQSSVRTGSLCTKMLTTVWRLSDQTSLNFQAFTTGDSKDPNKSIGVETNGTVTHPKEAELTSSPATGSL